MATKAAKLLVVIDLNLETSQSLTGPSKPRPTYSSFAAHLQEELTKRGLPAEVVLNNERRLVLDPAQQFEHVAVLRLQSMYSSTGYGDSNREWVLTVLQRGVEGKRPLLPLLETAFFSNFEGCYLFQVTVSDNKAECRAKIVSFFVEQLSTAGVIDGK